MSNKLVKQNQVLIKYTQEEIDIIKKNYAKDATDLELHVFLGICRHLQLDPFKSEIYFAKISGRVCVMTSITGLRNRAIETGMHRGRTIPLFCGKDGVWKEIWAENEPPFACKVGIKKEGYDEPQYAIAEWNAYAKQYNGKPSGMWAQMGTHMLAKCAEALAIRIAFSSATHNMYIHEEMSQAKNTIINDKIFTVYEKEYVTNQITEITNKYKILFNDEEFRKLRRDSYMHALGDFKAGCDVENIDFESVVKNYIPEEKLTTIVDIESELQQTEID